MAALVLAYAAVAPLQVLTMTRFQEQIQGASRATTTSAMSMCCEMISVVFTLLSGLAMTHLGVLPAYQLGGIYLLIFTLWSFWQTRAGRTVTG